MDLSKLPKLSDTKAQEPAAIPPPMAIPVDAATPDSSRLESARFHSSRPMPSQAAQPDGGQNSGMIGLAEAWISVGVGAFILLFWPRFLQWASSRLFHTHFNEFLKDVNDPSTVVPYTTVPEFWSDLGPTLLGVVLIVDGLLMFSRRPMLLMLAMALTCLSTLYNLWYVASSFSTYGIAPVSALAVIFGGFILMTQWVTYQRLTPRVNR